jgi:hypothetical protein
MVSTNIGSHIYRIIVLKLFVFILAFSSLCSTVFASEYPKSKEEKLREKNGSILGGEGIVFRWGKESDNNNEKLAQKQSYKKTLLNWDAALDFVRDMPILYIDYNKLLIITDWYTKENSNSYEQVKIIIDADGKGFQVHTFLKNKKSGLLSESKKLSEKYKSEILSKSTLYKK